MDQSTLFVTKYAVFDKAKVIKFPKLLKFFKRQKRIPQLQDLLWKQQQWQISQTIGDQRQNIERQFLLQTMVINFCVTINFKYFWGSEHRLLGHIEFRKLKELTFSVDSDAGYLKTIEFISIIESPNLVKLNLSNMEDGGYSLSPLRKCYFPKLQMLDLSYYSTKFRDISKLYQAYFPSLGKIVLEQYVSQKEQDLSNHWKAKMQSLFLRKQFQKQLFVSEQNEVNNKVKKRIKTI